MWRAWIVLMLVAVLGLPQLALSAAGPQRGGTLVYSLDGSPDRLDPNLSGLRPAQIVFFQIFDPLVVRDPKDASIKPWLATSWTVSADGKVYTFHLRPGVMFQDGTPFDAAAVKFNLDRTHNPALGTRCGGCAVGFYESTEVVDRLTVRIHLKSPWAPFLDAASLFYRMVSPAGVAKVGDQNFGQHPVGSGPFRFVEWVPNDRVVLERTPGYAWASPLFGRQGPALLDRVVFRIIPEPSTRVGALQAGEVQVTTAVSPQDFQRLAHDPKFRPIVGLAPGAPYSWAINVTKAPTDDLAVRQAMEYGINRDLIARVAYGPFQTYGAYRPAYTLLSPVTWGYDKQSEIYRYDPAKARALLDAAGWKTGPDGTRRKGDQRLVVVFNAWEHGIPELVQAELRSIGIDVHVGIYDALTVNENQRKGESNMSPLPGARTDPDILSAWLHSRNVGSGGFNFSFVKDPALDKLFDAGATEVDPARRKQIYAQAEQYAMDKAYMLPITTRDNVSLESVKVEDLRFDATGFFPWLYDTWLQP
ncbi:MAG TPA: ABC transporter substrate-binding protein [bacterium]|nr:ABC transporter substrate-binding protein [bacterium]